MKMNLAFPHLRGQPHLRAGAGVHRHPLVLSPDPAPLAPTARQIVSVPVGFGPTTGLSVPVSCCTYTLATPCCLAHSYPSRAASQGKESKVAAPSDKSKWQIFCNKIAQRYFICSIHRVLEIILKYVT